MSTSYERALAWLGSRPDFETRPFSAAIQPEQMLARPLALLESLGRPDSGLRVIHVAGTKGKGSTSALIASILQAHGQHVGLYTQPHLHTLRERVRINGDLISAAELASQIDQLRPAVEQIDRDRPDLGPLTVFEIVTVLAMTWFARRRVDWAVLEVGLGGRLDATNVVVPALSVITPISLDHTAILGRTRAAIAQEKAGIIKPGIPVVSARQPASVRAVLRAVAASRGAPLLEFEDEPGTLFRRFRPLHLLQEGAAGTGLPLFNGQLRTARRKYQGIDLHLAGRHQLLNLATAVRATEQLEGERFALLPEQVAAGIASLRWPGRFEVAQREPLIVLDAAHNGVSARALRRALDLHARGGRLHLILGAMVDKDLDAILKPFADAVEIVAVEIAGPRGRTAESIIAATRSLGVRSSAAPTVAKALSALMSRCGSSDVIVATGSFRIVAAAREALALPGSEQKDPTTAH